MALLRRHVRTADADNLVERVVRISDHLPDGWPIGLEHKLLRRGFGQVPVGVAAVASPLIRDLRFLSHPSEERDKLLRRPPSELSALSLWERAATGPVGIDDLFAASGRTGGGDHFRPARMATSTFPSGHYLEFVPAHQVRPRFERLVRRLNVTEPDLHPLLHAIAVYYETLLIHPLRDGNGRLARLLFQLSLRNTIGLRAPILPLGPASASSRPALIGAYLAWEFDRESQPLVDFIFAALKELTTLYEKDRR